MTEADVREMVSVIYALEMDSDTISAIQFMMKLTTMSALRDLSPQNGVESLHDISEKKSGRQTYYLKEKSSIKIKLTNTRFVLIRDENARPG